ncbi:MAG: hypothetical protein KF684_04130 [Phycisphaeraceae bacterium]|nr:hypothetical protein [Phycisphaeraceae bacterium]
MRHGQLNIPVGPDWTDVFIADEIAGDGEGDGVAARGMLLCVPADAGGPVEYRWRTQAGDYGDGATPPQLNPGDCAPLVGGASPIVRIQARGVGDPSAVQLEETHR